MGQQQLLLLVLAIVIVGLAVVGGITAFDERRRKSARDALVDEAIRLATSTKAWYGKPASYEGADGVPGNLTGVTWGDIGVEGRNVDGGTPADADGAYRTPHGAIAMSGGDGNVVFTVERANVDATPADATDSPFGTVTFDPNPNADAEDIQISFASSD